MVKLVRTQNRYSFSGSLFISSALLLASLILSIPGHSAPPEELATVRIPVANESDSERYRATYEGLSEVLVRLSGKKQVLQEEPARQILDKSSAFLLQFSYQGSDAKSNRLLMKEHPLDPGDENSESLKILTLKFDQSQLLNALQENGLPVWDPKRAEVMVWWIAEEGGKRDFFFEGNDKKSQNALGFYASQRGLPIRFPLMDLRDQSLVKLSDVWGGYSDQLAKANKRYGINTWVTGKHWFEKGQWHASWSVNILGKKRAFRSKSADITALQKAVMGNVANLLAEEYSVVAGQTSEAFYLKVLDIDSLDDFNSLKNYLENLFVVAELKLVRVKGPEVTFLVRLNEDQEKFRKLLKLDKRLAPIEFQQLEPRKVEAGLSNPDTVGSGGESDAEVINEEGESIGPGDQVGPAKSDLKEIIYQWLPG